MMVRFFLVLGCSRHFFCFDRRPVPFGGSRCETYSFPRHDRGPVPEANRSAASCLCMVLKRAFYHCSARSPAWLLSPTNLNAIFTWLPIACNVLLVLFLFAAVRLFCFLLFCCVSCLVFFPFLCMTRTVYWFISTAFAAHQQMGN